MTVIDSRDAVVRVLSREEINAERQRLLAEAGMAEATLRRRGEEYELDAVKRGVLADLDALDWLLTQTEA